MTFTPLQLKNTPRRFGVVAACAAALRGANVSRNGRPSVMPPSPRKNERRLDVELHQFAPRNMKALVRVMSTIRSVTL